VGKYHRRRRWRAAHAYRQHRLATHMRHHNLIHPVTAWRSSFELCLAYLWRTLNDHHHRQYSAPEQRKVGDIHLILALNARRRRMNAVAGIPSLHLR